MLPTPAYESTASLQKLRRSMMHPLIPAVF
jgi:hypothetical protein